MVATTTQVADLVREVGGDRVSSTACCARAATRTTTSRVRATWRPWRVPRLVFRSGGEVDEWLGDVIDSAGGDAEVVCLIDSVKRARRRPALVAGPAQRRAGGRDDPRAARRSPTRPAGPPTRATPAHDPAAARLDRQIAACIERVPAAKRKIVTTHDALGYFARRYGIEVVGAVIPSLSTQAQASAGDVQRLVEQIRREGVEAVFPESSVNPDIERAIAREAGARIGDPLYADSLGPKGSAGETYIGALAADAGALVRGMSGGRVDCRALAAPARGALAPQRHVVRVDRVVRPGREPLDRALEARVLERGHLAAALADDVVVVLAARADGLVARHALGGVHAPGEPQLVEQLERPVDARHAHVLAAPVQAVRDLLGGDAAAEVGERLDHGRARAAQAIALALELALRVSNPIAHCLKHATSSTSIQMIVGLGRAPSVTRLEVGKTRPSKLRWPRHSWCPRAHLPNTSAV